MGFFAALALLLSCLSIGFSIWLCWSAAGSVSWWHRQWKKNTCKCCIHVKWDTWFEQHSNKHHDIETHVWAKNSKQQTASKIDINGERVKESKNGENLNEKENKNNPITNSGLVVVSLCLHFICVVWAIASEGTMYEKSMCD